MLATALSGVLVGIDGLLVEVEVDVALGFPQFPTVGLSEGAVRESKDRVRSTIKNSGYEFPARKITVSLAPADIKKEGSAYNLPIALGIFAAAAFLDKQQLAQYVLFGELSLDGRVKPVQGILPLAVVAKERSLKGVLVLQGNAAEAVVVEGVEVFGAPSLSEAFLFLNQQHDLVPESVNLQEVFAAHSDYDTESYPANIMLVSAMNPCPCGVLGGAHHEWRCTPQQIQRSRSKVSGPSLDRIDIQVEVPAVQYKGLSQERTAENSVTLRTWVNRARQVQLERFSGRRVFCNAHMTSQDTNFVNPTRPGQSSWRTLWPGSD